MTRAAIYARYSSHAQNDESIEQQVAECRAYAAAHDLAVEAVYADRAVTGRTDRRPEFQKMIRAAEAHSFDVVIAYKSNRIARNMLHALQYEARFDKCGVRVVYVREEFGDTATGRFMLRSMMNLNQFYSENLSEDVMRGMTENARQCRVNGKVPYGYRATNDGHYAIDPVTGPIAREIFERLAAGEQQIRVAEDLNARHIPSPSGGRWGKQSFWALVRNERYVGTYIFGEVRVEHGIPALITEDVFAAAAHGSRPSCTARKRTPGVVYMLSGKLYCGECRARMTGVSAHNHAGQPYYYYRCTGCGHTRIRKDAIEDAIVRELCDCIMSDATIDRLIALVMQYRGQLAERSRAAEIEAQLRDTRRAKANILRAIESTTTHVQTLADRLAELDATEADLERDLLREKSLVPEVTEDSVRFYFEQFRRGAIDDPAYRRLLIDTFLSAAYVYPDRITVTFPFTGQPTDLPSPQEDVSLTSDGGHHICLKLTSCGLIALTFPR